MDSLTHALVGALIGELSPKRIKNRQAKGALAAMAPDMANFFAYPYLGIKSGNAIPMPIHRISIRTLGLSIIGHGSLGRFHTPSSSGVLSLCHCCYGSKNRCCLVWLMPPICSWTCPLILGSGAQYRSIPCSSDLRAGLMRGPGARKRSSSLRRLYF